jgi:hypothetical protein
MNTPIIYEAVEQFAEPFAQQAFQISARMSIQNLFKSRPSMMMPTHTSKLSDRRK